MGDRRRVISDLFRGKFMSAAASEAFSFLNALTKTEYRGWGDTATAARDRAARKAGVSRAQAERVWKRWQNMKTVNGDVYRSLRNAYESACIKHETAAGAYRVERLNIEAHNAAHQSPNQAMD